MCTSFSLYFLKFNIFQPTFNSILFKRYCLIFIILSDLTFVCNCFIHAIDLVLVADTEKLLLEKLRKWKNTVKRKGLGMIAGQKHEM